MKKNTAFFAVARKYLEDPEWLAEPFTKAQAWLDIIGRASFADGDVTRRGELLISERGLAKRWKWPESKVRRFLQKLENDGRITRSINRSNNRSGKRSIITVEKYELYQNPRSKNRSDNRSDERRLYNNIDNIDNISLYTPDGAEAEEIARLFGEKADQLIEDVRNYYTAHPEKHFPGWPIALTQFDANQKRWGTANKPRQKTDAEIIAEMEKEGMFE